MGDSRVEYSVENNKERKHALDRLQRTADDETKNSPTEKSESHGLLSSNFVHKQATDNTAWQIETVDYCPIANVLNQCVLRIQLANDG